MKKTLPSVCKIPLPAQTVNEIIITPDFDGATHQQKLDGLTMLFTGLARAITDHGCQVDLSDTLNIRIFKE